MSEVYKIHIEIDAIVSRGFSRDQAVKIFFGNHPEQKCDPTAAYNFDKGNGSLSLSNPSSVRTNSVEANRPGSNLNNISSSSQNANDNNQWTLPTQHPFNGADSNRYEEEHIQNLMSKGLSRAEAEDAHSNRKKGAASVRRPSDTVKLASFVASQQSNNSTKSESIKIQTTTTVVSTEIDDNLSLSPEDHAPIRARTQLLNRKASMQPSFSAADEVEIQLLIGQGYPRMVAVQMYVQKGRLGGLSDVVIESNNNSAKLSSANSLSYSRSQTPTPSGERVITAADFGDTRGYSVSGKQSAQGGSSPAVRERSLSPVVMRSQQYISQNQSPVPKRTNSGGQETLTTQSPLPLARHGSTYMDNNISNNHSHRDYSAQPQSVSSHPSLPRRPSGVISALEEDLPAPLSSTNAAKQRQRRPSATGTAMIGSDSRDNWETQSTHSYQSTTSRSVLLVPERLPPAHTTLARGNSNNSGTNEVTPRTASSLANTYPPRSTGSAGSRAGSVSGDSVNQIEDDNQYYERLMSRGYTEEQAELAVQQRVQQSPSTITPLKQSVLKRAGESTNSMTSGGTLSRHSSAGNAGFETATNGQQQQQQQQHYQQNSNNNYQTDSSYQQQDFNVRSGGSVSSQQSNSYYQQQQPVNNNNYPRQDYNQQQNNSQYSNNSNNQQQNNSQYSNNSNNQQQNNSQYSNNSNISQRENNNSNNDFNFMRQESGGSYQTVSSGEEQTNTERNREREQETYEPPPRSTASEMSTFSSDEQYAFGEWLCKGYSEQQSVDMVLQERTRNMEAIAQALSEMDMPQSQHQQQQPMRRLESNQSVMSAITSTAGSRHQSNYSMNSRQDSIPPLNFSQQSGQHMGSQQQMYTSPDQFSPPATARSAVTLSADDEALRVAMLISEQESEFGENMYERLSAADDEEIRLLVEQGYSPDDAVLVIFQRTHRSRNPNVYIPMPIVPQRRPSFATTPPLPPQQQQQLYAPQYPPQQQQGYPPPQQYQEQGHHLHSSMSFHQEPQYQQPQQQHHLHHSQSFQQPSHNQQQYQQQQPQFQQTYHPSQPQMEYHQQQQQQQYAPPQAPYPSAYPSGRSRAGSTTNSQTGSRNGSRGHSRPSSRAGSPSRDRDRDAYGNRVDASSPHTQSTGGLFSSFFGGSRASSSGHSHAHNQHQRDEYASQQQGGGSSHNSSYHAAETKAELAMRKKLHYRESDVRVLVDMGYSKEQAVQALVENNNNVGLAAEMLARS